MSQESKFDQFIYGKFVVGNDSEYRLVYHSESLKNNNISALEGVHEKNYYFWGSQSSDYNRKAVGICRNNTPILPEKQIILIQASPAVNKDQGIFSISGSRSFFQHRYIFVSEAEIAGFNNQICKLLGYLGNMPIPTFSSLNNFSNYEQQSLLLGQEYLDSLLAKETTEKKVRETIEKVWKKLNNSEKKILLQGLDVILNGKRLLLTDKKKTQKPLLLLDNLLLFLPANVRNKISLAINSVHPEDCKWAQIILKLDGSSIRSLPENMVWLDINQSDFDKEKYLDHEYVKYFIDPNKDKDDNLITICEYLDKVIKDDSDDLVWDFQEVDGWFKLNNPPIDFIFNYPAEERDKIKTLRKYIPRMEEKVQSFLDKFEENSSILESEAFKLKMLWETLPESKDNGNLMKTLLCKIYRYLPDKFLEIVKADKKFINYLGILIENKFLDSLEIDSLEDENFIPKILQELQKACSKLIEKCSKNYSEREKLIIGCEKIFPSEKDKFDLWDLALVGEITMDDFKHLFIERLFPIFSVLDRETFEQSHLKQYWKKNFPHALDSMAFYLSGKERKIVHVPEIANGLEISNSEASKLYLTCLKSHSPNYEQSLPLLKSAIQKSVSLSGEKVEFQANDFMRVYQWFDSQDFQDKSPNKGKLLSILDNLVRDSNYNFWISWQELSNFIYDNDIRQTIFLDKTIGKGFLVEVLEAWFKLLDTHQKKEEVKAKFMASKAWELLNRETLEKMRENLTGTYQKYVGEFIQWANKKQRLELISGELIEYITEIWCREKSIDESLWNLLNSEGVLPKLSNKDCLKLIDVQWRLSADPLLLMPTSLHKRAEKFSPEEKESLMKCATKIVPQFQDRQSLKKFINKCRLFYDNSELLEIMRYADNDVRKGIFYDDIIR